MDGKAESREVTQPCRTDKKLVQDINPNFSLKIHPILIQETELNIHTTSFSRFAVFFFFFLTEALSSHVPTLTHFSLMTSVALGPVTPVTCSEPGCLLPLPRLPRPGSPTAGAESLASEHHFLGGALPPEGCSGKLFISHRDSDRDRIGGTHLSGHRCLPPWQMPHLPAVPHLPEAFFLSRSPSSPVAED